MIHQDLRPLGVGEILDRAVTLYVRRFAVFLLILALVAVPIAILQYIAQPNASDAFADMTRIMTMPPGHSAETQAIIKQMNAQNHVGGLVFMVIFASIILSMLSYTACAIAVAQSYAGAQPSVRSVYLAALRRWPAQLMTAIVFIGVGLVVFVALVLVATVVSLAIAAIGAASKIAATAVGIVLAIIAVLIVLAITILYTVAAQMSFVSIALEEPNPARAIPRGVRRTFARPVLWRSLLVGMALVAVSVIGSFVLIGTAAVATAITHVNACYPIIVTTGSIALNALLTTFVVIYAIDVRVRREGYDLILEANNASA